MRLKLDSRLVVARPDPVGDVSKQGVFGNPLKGR